MIPDGSAELQEHMKVNGRSKYVSKNPFKNIITDAQKQINLNSSIFIFKIEFMIKNFPRKKTAVPNDFNW